MDGKKKDTSRAALERYLHYCHPSDLEPTTGAAAPLLGASSLPRRSVAGILSVADSSVAVSPSSADTRFTNHHNSLKFEIEAKTSMEAKIKDMEALGDNTWMDCQYLHQASAPMEPEAPE